MAGHRVLIVEDDPLIARLEEIRLTGMGHVIVGKCTSGEEALELAGEHRPDVVIMDINLAGELTGIEAGREIAQKLTIPLVYLTSHTDKETFEHARSSGECEYLLKPFTDLSLAIAIEMVVYKHREAEKIRKEQAHFLALFRDMGDAILSTNKNGFLLWANPAAGNLLGLPKTVPESTHISEYLVLIDGLTGKMLEDPVERVIRQGESLGLPPHAVLVSGTGSRTTPVHGTVSLVRDEHGRVTGVALTLSPRTPVHCISIRD